MLGKEYLIRAYQRIAAGQPITAYAYGDSTVSGTNQSAPFLLQALLPALAKSRGLHLSLTNRGATGTDVSALDAIPDLSSADLILVKYGINDGMYPMATRRTTFEATLRSKLAAVRAVAGVAALSIVLVGPNTTSDTPSGRDARWYEQLHEVYARAARDYQCAYFDTFAYMPDARGAAGVWMDDPFGDGRAIHPGDVMHAWIWGAVFDWLFGASETAALRPARPGALVPLTLANGWANHGGGWEDAQAGIDACGWVTLTGIVGGGATAPGTVLAALPAGMRPAALAGFACMTHTGTCALRVDPSGDVVAHTTADATYTSLAGIRFKAA